MAEVPPRARQYTPADLWPPGSQGNVQFPPAAFFPVFVGNFKCEQRTDLPDQVRRYFASKGLLVRMVFNSRMNDKYLKTQKHNKLYDCLAYFVRPEDANDAVQFLHRDLYHGHRLSVFSGRFPALFDPDRSVRFHIVNYYMECTEQVLENRLVKLGANVVTIVKHSVKDAYVEFSDQGNMLSIIRQYKFAEPNRVRNGQMAQRYLEEDIRRDIVFKEFLSQMPSDEILDAFFNGEKPQITEDWHSGKVPKVKMRMTGKSGTRMFKERNFVRKLVNNFGLQAPDSDKFRLTADTIVGRALRRVRQKATKKGLSLERFEAQFPAAYQVYRQTAGEDWRTPVPYVRYRELPADGSGPYTYDDLYNLGLEYIKSTRTKHRYGPE